jgi:hypothetical protein
MYLVAVAFVFWLFAGTYLMKSLLRRQRPGRKGRLVIFAFAVLLAAMPAAVLKINVVPFSLVAFFAAGISLFWFPILAARASAAI